MATKKSKAKSATKKKPAKAAKKTKKKAPPRKAASPKTPPRRTLDVPPLPTLEWTQKHWYCWYGKEVLSSWKGMRFHSKFMNRKPKPHDGTVDISIPIKGDEPNEPTASQIATYRYLKDNEEALTKRVLARILEEYPEQKRAYEEAVDDTWPTLPEVTTVDGLSAVIGPPTIHLYDNVKEPGAVGDIGFAFDCAWDEEHQLGLLISNGEVQEFGDGSTAGHIRE